MRKGLYPIVCTLAAGLLASACKPSPELTETTPKFFFPSDTVFTTRGDTLLLRGNLRNGIALDSLTVGDTALIPVEIDGVFHPLTEVAFSLTPDTVAEALLSTHEGATPTYAVEAVLPLTGGQKRVAVTLHYHAVQPAYRPDLTLSARSEASGDNATGQLTLRLPIAFRKAKKGE